ncbi:MAG: hypothetical protein GY771_09050 [bacterium]|nr:hypothetical protein [bacterium]
MRYQYHGQYLDHFFIDGTQGDWTAWKKSGSSYYGQCSVVNPEGIITWMDDYGINMTGLINAIEEIIYGSGIESTSLGELKATYK